MTALATKPVRIYAADHTPLRLIAEIEGRGAAEVVHAALAEYLQNHRDVLATAFAEAQDAVADGDIAALAAIAGRSSKRRAQAAMQRHEAL
jgi:hypothetical protein